ncbi:hypothetical protein GQO96_05880 [Acinetobacter baumannii]|nr:hypothetical protein [Acinetobacter baumannii]ELB1972173.1 hypothetical protein [Acinetobacter baumannii]QLB34861.1 hypothetical protein GQO96_05880 [Acinetobacter baumannii]
MTDLNKERAAFLNTFQYYKGRRDIIFSHEHELFMTRSNNPSEIAQKEISNMNSRWDAWLRCAKHRDAGLENAKAQAVPEGYVLVEKKNTEDWYLDEDEGMWFDHDGIDNSLCDLDAGQVQAIKHKEYLITESNTLFATIVWDEANEQIGFWEFFKTKEEAEEAATHCKAMIKASESGAEK